MMLYKRAVVLLLVVLLAFFMRTGSQPAHAIGVANVIVTNVYWGGNPANPDTAHPGDTNLQLSILVTNVGDDVARSVNATLMISQPLIYSYYLNGVQHVGTSITQVAGDLQAGQGYTLRYTLSVDPQARDGIYRNSLQLSYKSARELQQVNSTEAVDIPVWKGELHVQGVATTPIKVYPDSKAVVVRVMIVNSGQGAAKDLQLRLDLKMPFAAASSGSDEIFVGTLAVGSTAEADFVVDVAGSAIFGQYSIILGHVSGDQLIPIGQVPLYVNEKVRFEILSVTPSTVHSGDSGDVIKVEIRNSGTVKADSVRVELRVGNFFTGTLTDFLGTILSNETKVAFFTVDIDSKAQPGQYTIDLRFDWTQDNNSLDDTFSITFSVESPATPTSLIALVVIVAVGAAGLFYMRRRRTKAASQPTAKNSK